MRTLHHLWLCPFARKVRIVLAEKKLEFELIVEKVWERREEFLALNPAGEVPVFIEETGDGGGIALADSYAICEYLEEAYPDPPLVEGDAITRAEIRRLVAWFDQKFHREVTQNLVDEFVPLCCTPVVGFVECDDNGALCQ